MEELNYRCPCCGYYTLGSEIGTYEICPVCFWEDDSHQRRNAMMAGGANEVSLIQARENFRSFGACEKRLIPYVRAPRQEEFSGIDAE